MKGRYPALPVYDPAQPAVELRARVAFEKYDRTTPLAPMPRHVWFHPEPIRLARQDSLPKGRRGGCTETELFPAPYIFKPTGLETSCFNGESVFLGSPHGIIQRYNPCLPVHGSTPLKSILVTSAVL